MIALRYCSIGWTAFGATTIFHSGREVSAWPHWDDHHYHALSHRLGYGDDLLAYAREHELAHSVAAAEFSNAPSYVLHALAHGEPIDQGRALLEEMAALTIQRWVRANERPLLSGCDWDSLRAEFIGYVEALNAEQPKAA